MSRIDWRSELDNIYEGMAQDLQDPVGQTVDWYLYDSTSTTVDEIYDVGAIPAGRKWKAPKFLPVLGAIKLEGEEVQNDRGFYVLDTLQVIFSSDAAQKSGLGDIIYRPDQHNVDRLVYENKVFGIDNVRVRGVLKAGYAVCAAQCRQIKREELVNDGPQFQPFIALDTD